MCSLLPCTHIHTQANNRNRNEASISETISNFQYLSLSLFTTLCVCVCVCIQKFENGFDPWPMAIVNSINIDTSFWMLNSIGLSTSDCCTKCIRSTLPPSPQSLAKSIKFCYRQIITSSICYHLTCVPMVKDSIISLWRNVYFK